jgi:membrane peptidoglycan carboxypeptidase
MKKTFAHLIHAVRHYYMLIIPLVILSACFYYYILRDLPSPIALGDGSPAQSTQIFDRNDTLLYTIYADKNSSFISLSHIPKTVQDATIAVEDKDFYHHGAIDMRGVLRAIVSNLMRKPLQGGSTLTQQLIKNSLLTQDRTIQRKAKEVVLSFATELIYPKKLFWKCTLIKYLMAGQHTVSKLLPRHILGKTCKTSISQKVPTWQDFLKHQARFLLLVNDQT